MNLVIFSGNLSKDAKVINTSTGKKFLVTTLALREDLRPDSRSATFVDLVIWGDRAEKLAKYLTKGKPISVTGRLEIIKTIKNNYTYITPRVVVSNLEFIGKKTPEPVNDISTNNLNENLSEGYLKEDEVQVDTSVSLEEDVPF